MRELQARRPFWGAYVAAVIAVTLYGTVPAVAQTIVSGARTLLQVLGTDGTTILNVGDVGNNAVRVSIVSGGGGGTQYAEDAALGSTPTGTVSMARRTDTLATLTPIVDDAVSMRTNNRGALWTAIDGTVAATQSGTWNVGSVTSITNALPAGTALIGKAAQPTACGATVFSQAIAAVPTSSTAAAAATTCVQMVVACNTNATGQTFTLSDNAGTPLVAVNALSIPGNSCAHFPFGGVAFTSGVKWSAGGSGVVGAIVGLQ
jgi:hypothetical protein